ncbi:phosphoribosylformylglycinamidine synthase subunit PurS [Mobilicoccus massiliensis]|uniref:phosphoribosylformylglycinamidine synthase subunit PurS n=1 Tax=Mobilicoccus massiliensis TaxID=1522310 RepID=UPI0009E1AB76|nr:phosphoribosylformylglycinamidine synthase subunit PurS [Mobilicoccus massiliensis]
MGNVVVDVMPKSTELDPLGRAVTAEVAASSFPQVLGVRQGKRFVVAVEGEVTDEVLALVRQLAEKSMITPGVDEIVSVREAGDAQNLDDDLGTDWDDMPEHWGAGESDVPLDVAQPSRRPAPAHHEIDETMLGHVEAGSYYGRADDVKS